MKQKNISKYLFDSTLVTIPYGIFIIGGLIYQPYTFTYQSTLHPGFEYFLLNRALTSTWEMRINGTKYRL